MRSIYFINPATVTPFAVAIPAAVALAIADGLDSLLPALGIGFMVGLGFTIVWLPIAGTVLVRLPGSRFSPLVLGVGCIATALAFCGFGILAQEIVPQLGAGVPKWLSVGRFALSGAYFGVIATLCLYVDRDFRSPARD